MDTTEEIAIYLCYILTNVKIFFNQGKFESNDFRQANAGGLLT